MVVPGIGIHRVYDRPIPSLQALGVN